jgi:PLP dependent protein
MAIDVDAAEVGARLAAVEARVQAACTRAGRARASVTLLAVSKLMPIDALVAAHTAGQRDFAENYAQELRDKASDARLAGARFHAIGALQTNKAKYVAAHAFAFHALDREELAHELSKRRAGKPPLQCFLEVNIAGEATKHGVHPAALPALLAAVRAQPNLEVAGLMCMPPAAELPEASRPHFAALRALAQHVRLAGLSMGSTDDFEVAIEEGATHVRVGRAIFGERPT